MSAAESEPTARHQRSGDEHDVDYASFVSGTTDALLHAAWLLTGDQGVAEELVQSVLVRLYPVWARVQDGDPLAYARRMLVNARTDGWRRLRSERLMAQTPELRWPDLEHDKVDDRDALRRALWALSARERRIVVLRYYFDLPVDQVALDLGISTGTVKSTTSRALEKLRVRLQPESEPSRSPDEQGVA